MRALNLYYLVLAKIGNSVEDIKSFMMENPFELDINVTTYDANLQYECPLAQEFLVNSNSGKTEAKLNKTCSWDETWMPDDLIPPCICKLQMLFFHIKLWVTFNPDFYVASTIKENAYEITDLFSTSVCSSLSHSFQQKC